MARQRIDFNALSRGSRLFLAEGSSELGLLNSAIESLGIDRAAVFDVQGEKNLNTVLKRAADQTGSRGVLACLGIVFDANDSYPTKLQSIAAALTSAGFVFDAAGLNQYGVFRGGNVPIGIYISPTNNAAGRIETMILGEVAASPVDVCVNNFATCVEQRSGRQMDEKGRVQAYLASFNAAHGVAVAFEKGVLDIKHNTYAGVRRMLAELTRP
jgi:Protein of unknown function (DUF3226)